jgi:hypothetical protein
LRRIGLLICGVIALVAAGAAMTGTAYAEVTIHLSKKPVVKGEKVRFTIFGTEKGATYVVTVTAGDTVETLATGTDPDGGKVRGNFKVPDLGPSAYKVRIEAQVTQGGAIWLDSHKVKYSPVPVATNTAPAAKSKPVAKPVTPKAPVSNPTPARTTPTPAPTVSIPTRRRSTPSPTRRRTPSVSGIGTRRAPRLLQGPTGRISPPSTATPPATAPRSATPTAQTSPKAQASPARTFAIPIGVVVAVGVLTLISLAGAEARLLRSPAEVGRTKGEAEMARLRALERAAERAI